MAWPHRAMAHWGSCFAAARKSCSDSVYWNECSRATAFSRPGCASDVQLVGKLTLPSSSGRGLAEAASRRPVTTSEAKRSGASMESERLTRRMAGSPRAMQGFYTVLTSRVARRYHQVRCGWTRIPDAGYNRGGAVL